MFNLRLKSSQSKLKLCQLITKEMLNWYKINLAQSRSQKKRQLLCIQDNAGKTEKCMEPRRRSAWNWVLNHRYAHCFIWKFECLSISAFLTRQLSFTAFLVRQQFSCATGHKQDEMDVLVIQSQQSRCLVFLMLNISSPKLAELCTAPQAASLYQAVESKGMSGGRRKYQHNSWN